MRRNQRNSKSDVFSGEVRLHIESVKDYAHLDEFCRYLKSIDNLEIVFYTWTDKSGVVVFVYLEDSVPLADKLCQIPIVNYVSKIKKKDIIVELNGSYTDIIAAIQKTLKEGILVV
jgi:hypothetical protein